MKNEEQQPTLPTDQFSLERRRLSDNPGAIGSGSTVHLPDFYGNLETWVVETFRADGSDTVFLQRNKSNGADRIMLPPQITATIARQQASINSRVRRRGARQAAATREARGIKPAFLKGKKR